ncbi:transcription initiation factor TFIID subunit 6 [Drosophila novamexicana]|uniref:transcription initiation factor TFIID subunit 6 n=1 Tax=Drosophila novamexicana TaxID=47314 RepID=UPI0011E5CB3A|nr:transcription initiation factor TFIID subunit 6 [Drosophila novamexicana]
MKMKYYGYIMDSINEDWKRIYTATLSRTSLQNISKVYIGETLTGHMVHTVAQNVREDISKIVVEAVKYARRTRSSKVKMEHLLFALEEHNINLDLLHLNYNWPESEDKEDTVSTSRVIKRKCQMPLDTASIRRRSLTPEARALTAPTSAPKRWLKREQVLLMGNKKFPLSKEQQEFFVLITETCMGISEPTRRDALQRLSSDSSLQPMLPKLSLFIGEAVKVNVVQQNFALLLYLMRMVHSLLVNSNLKLQNYLHLFIPAVLSCTVSQQVCAFPAVQNHWALREYAANIMAELVKTFDSDDNSIMPRVINIYKAGLPSSSLTTIYGSLIGLRKMGKYAVRGCVIPQIRAISAIIEMHLTKEESDNDLNKQAAIYIRHRLLKMSAPILKNMHEPPDILEQYSRKYGFLGCSLYDAVVLERIMDDVVEEADEQKLSAEIAAMD